MVESLLEENLLATFMSLCFTGVLFCCSMGLIKKYLNKTDEHKHICVKRKRKI